MHIDDSLHRHLIGFPFRDGIAEPPPNSGQGFRLWELSRERDDVEIEGPLRFVIAFNHGKTSVTNGRGDGEDAHVWLHSLRADG